MRMNRMTIKQTERWLYRAWNTSEEIKAKMAQLEEATSQVTSITAQMSGMPGSVSKDPHARMDKYIILSGNLQSQIDRLAGTLNEITEVIDKVPDGQLRTLLTERYLNRRKWEDVSELMHYSYEGGYIFRLNREALKAVKDILESVH